jgi:hypothetical protein
LEKKRNIKPSTIRKLTHDGLSHPDYFTTSQGTPYWVSIIRWLLCVPIFNGPLNKDLYLFIANGEHEIESYIGYPLKKNQKNKDGTVAVRNYLIIEIPITIIGESREHCIIKGGLSAENK